jgi:hypothetical protein
VRLGFIAISTAPKRRPAVRLVGEQRPGQRVVVGADHHLVGGQQLHRFADHVLDDRPAVVEPRQLVGERIEAPQPLAFGERRRRRASRFATPFSPRDSRGLHGCHAALGLRCRCLRPRRAYRLTARKKEASARKAARPLGFG